MTESQRLLEGRVAVITGAGRGIGRAIAIGYAAEGASVCCAARTTSEIDEVVREIKSAGGSAITVQADVTSYDDVERMNKAAADAFGGIDIVVINAGGNIGAGPVEASDPEDWTATVDLNLKGAYYTARSAHPLSEGAWWRQDDHHRLRHRTQRPPEHIGVCMCQGRLLDAHPRACTGTLGIQHQR